MLGIVLRFGLLAIALILMGISFVKAQAEHTIVLFPEPDSLTIYVPPSADGLSVSIEGLQLRVTTNTGEIVQPLNDYVAFWGIPFGNLPTPICFRLVRNGVQSPIPTECQRLGVLLLTQQLASADVFWYDPNAAQMRLIAVRNPVGGEVFCPSGSNRCELLYLTPLTPTLAPVISPTVSVPATPPLTPSPEILQQDTLLQQAIARAWAGVERNEDWEPFAWEFDGVEMVLVPVGCFEMGSNEGDRDEQPVSRQCIITPFWIDRFEVTNHQYGSAFHFSELNDPRTGIDWYDAGNFCRDKNKRLPSELEWEYSARGPNALKYPWGDHFSSSHVAHGTNNNYEIDDVGSKPSGISWIGALDMAGSVWEWTSSIYLPYPYSGKYQISASHSAREYVLRGGSWLLYTNFATDLRSSNRYKETPYFEQYDIGFRCVYNSSESQIP